MLTKSGSKKRSLSSRETLVLCVNNTGYEVSLEPAKFYRVVPDADAEAHKQLRVVDESGEDYLYPASHFAHVNLPQSIRKAVFAAV